jgi:hypothetical protein
MILTKIYVHEGFISINFNTGKVGNLCKPGGPANDSQKGKVS